MTQSKKPEAPSLSLLFHPLSSFCQKVLVALNELGVPVERRIVDLGNEAERAALVALWPLGRFPVLRDDARGVTVPESSIIIEYLERRHSRPGRLIPTDADAALECRLRDRFFDLHVNVPMQKIVTDKLRPERSRDDFGVEQASAQLRAAYCVADEWLSGRSWAVGEEFSLADCAAAPALFYARQVVPFGGHQRNLASYFARLMERPSFARVLDEAKPYLSMFPG